jgi:hypothetical protein
MKLIAYYSGSDARWLVNMQPTDLKKIPYILFTRIRQWLLKWIVSEYEVPDKYLTGFILHTHKKAKIVIKPSVLKYTIKVPKKQHSGFNIMYYYPLNEYNRKYCQWVYGKDIIDRLKKHYGNKVIWIKVDGTYDLNYVFPVIDFYVRPNRHDGDGRLGRECKIQDIPIYWSQCNPNFNDIVRHIDSEIHLKSMFKCLYTDITCIKIDQGSGTLFDKCEDCEYYKDENTR